MGETIQVITMEIRLHIDNNTDNVTFMFSNRKEVVEVQVQVHKVVLPLTLV